MTRRSFRKDRPYLIGCGVIGVLGAAAHFLILASTSPSRQPFERIVRERQPIIAALEAYRQERGEYPEDLWQLVPAYLPALTTSSRYYREGASYFIGTMTGGIWEIYYRPEGVPPKQCIYVIEGWCVNTT